MKKKLFYLIMCIIAFIFSENMLFCQNTDGLTYVSPQYVYCKDNNVIDRACIEKISLIFKNSSHKNYYGADILLTIQNGNTIVYQKKHVINFVLSPNETFACDEFPLYQKVKNNFGPIDNSFKCTVQILNCLDDSTCILVFKSQIEYIEKNMKDFYVEPLKIAIEEAKSLEDLNKVGRIMSPNLDWEFRKELGNIILSFGFEDMNSFYQVEKTIINNEELKVLKEQKKELMNEIVQECQQELGQIFVVKQAELDGVTPTPVKKNKKKKK